MTDRPILFSAPMARALLAGTKTQTRRVLEAFTSGMHVDRVGPTGWQFTGDGGLPRMPIRLKFAVGDRLWVRESLQRFRSSEKGTAQYVADITGVPHRRVVEGDLNGRAHWQWNRASLPSIHMPRWASRLTLTVTEVRVQRLQEISEEDAIAEGLESQQGGGLGPCPGFKWAGMGYHAGTMSSWGKCYHTPHGAGRSGCSCNVAGPSPAQCAYRELWNHLNEARGYGWETNPWVVAVSFTVEPRNIDQVAA